MIAAIKQPSPLPDWFKRQTHCDTCKRPVVYVNYDPVTLKPAPVGVPFWHCDHCRSK